MKRIVLDTNAIIRFLAGDTQIRDSLQRAETVLIPVFVLAELFAGFKGGNREHENRQILDRFMQARTVRVCPATEETAEIFADIKQNQKKAGTPLPIHDLWIAAQAMENGALLVSYDAHFKKIPGLRLWPLKPEGNP